MSYHVHWSDFATNDLARFWLSASDRDDVSDAARRIDVLLQSDGPQAGESRAGTLRILIDLPLICYFRFRPMDRTVIVTGISYRQKQH